jgi:hypothetical protein
MVKPFVTPNRVGIAATVMANSITRWVRTSSLAPR